MSLPKIFTKKRAVLFILTTSLVIWKNLAEARQGCCSHHKGVCGCNVVMAHRYLLNVLLTTHNVNLLGK